MAVAIYPDLPQCEPSEREEITRVLSEVSENGVIRGRVMHRTPTYRLTLTHSALDEQEFEHWETWWAANYNSEVEVVWVVDNKKYQGVFAESPKVAYAPYKRFDVTTTLLVKKVP